jgi:hypothetical protein
MIGVSRGIYANRAIEMLKRLGVFAGAANTWLSCFIQAPPKRSHPSGVRFCLRQNSVSQRLFR